MEESLLEIEKWNEIERTFTDKFGWKEGLAIMINTSKKYTRDKSIYELSMSEDNRLIKDLREIYNKEMKCLEKEKAKHNE